MVPPVRADHPERNAGCEFNGSRHLRGIVSVVSVSFSLQRQCPWRFEGELA
jgi:hypothetical protein